MSANPAGAPRGRQAAALAAAVAGGFFLYYSGRRESDDALAFAALLAGVLLFAATLAFLSRAHRRGRHEPSEDEFSGREWGWFHFLRFGYGAAVLLLPIRLYVGYEWLNSGREKVGSSAWTGDDAGAAIEGFVQGALAKAEGEFPQVQGWYAWFLREVVLPNAEVFGWLVAWGEVIVGVALILGVLTGLVALAGGFMNANFLLAGTVSTNPILLALELVLIIGWRAAGWWGLDRWLIPQLRRDAQRRPGPATAGAGQKG